MLWSLRKDCRTDAPVAAATLSLCSSIILSILSHFEHIRSLRSSSILNLYLFSSCLFDAVAVRTLWLRYDVRIATVFTASFVIKSIILILEGQGKRYLTVVSHELPPESTSGIYNRTLFWWLNPLILRGFRSVLLLKDLYSTDESLVSERLDASISREWSKCKEATP